MPGYPEAPGYPRPTTAPLPGTPTWHNADFYEPVEPTKDAGKDAIYRVMVDRYFENRRAALIAAASLADAFGPGWPNNRTEVTELADFFMEWLEKSV